MSTPGPEADSGFGPDAASYDAMMADASRGEAAMADVAMGEAAMGEAAYVLEVTSPGIDRPLTEPRHWMAPAQIV